MIIGIDPKVDYAFKHLFGRDSTRPLLMHAIDSVLNPPPGHAIRDLEIRNPFNPMETAEGKLSILDIKARDQSGRQFNVEMQMVASRSYVKRIVYYSARLHQQQLEKGDDYKLLRPTISISFVNDVLFGNAAEYHLRFRLLEHRLYFPFSEDLEFHVLELPKFNKAPEELGADLDIWLYFLRHAEMIDSEGLPTALRRPEIERALEELRMLTQNDIDRERYEARRKAQLDHVSSLNDARLDGIEEGLAKGRVEGRVEGREEGLEEGVQIGTIQLLEKQLKLPVSAKDRLAKLSLEELTRMAEKLLEQAAQK